MTFCIVYSSRQTVSNDGWSQLMASGFGSRLKLILEILVPLSLPVLLWDLYTRDQLRIPVIESGWMLGFSLIFLIGGFVFSAASWHSMLGLCSSVPWSRALISSGMSVFGKYLPGKIWSVLGRAAFVADNRGLNIKTASLMSVKTQILDLWVGVLFGTIALQVLRVTGWLKIAIPLLWLGCTYAAVNLGSYHQKLPSHKWVQKLLHLNPFVPSGNFKMLLPFLLSWGCWSLGFFLFAGSLTVQPLPWALAGAFPLACVLGMLAIIAPGGLGVREGALIGTLSLLGLSGEKSLDISLAARAWYLFGEFSLFLIACCYQFRTRISRGGGEKSVLKQ